MPFNPIETADILTIKLNEYCIKWGGNSTSAKIMQEVLKTSATPESVVQFLLSLYTIEWKEDVRKRDFEDDALKTLTQAMLTQNELEAIPVEKFHKILIIESRQLSRESLGSLLRTLGHRHKIKKKDVKITYESYPPDSKQALKELLKVHTSAILHNLSMRDLLALVEFAQEEPALARRIVIVQTGDSITPNLMQQYETLEKLGMHLTRKPFPSYGAVERVVFGVNRPLT